MHNPKNFDPETGRPRMVVLDQFTLGNRNGFFYTSFRNALVPHLQRAEHRFFEGGFTNLWLQQITQLQYGTHIEGIMTKGYNIVQKNIGFIEMKPAWYAVVIGWTLGIIFLITDICFNMIKNAHW